MGVRCQEAPHNTVTSIALSLGYRWSHNGLTTHSIGSNNDDYSLCPCIASIWKGYFKT